MNTFTPSEGSSTIIGSSHPEKNDGTEGQLQRDALSHMSMDSLKVTGNKKTGGAETKGASNSGPASLASLMLKPKKEEVDGGDLDDHDDDDDDDDDDEGDTAQSGSGKAKRRRNRGEEDVPMTFPQRLMEILSLDNNQDIISWLPHGRGFMIYQKKKFAVEIMPKYFKKSKFTSFTRKLNRWNFTRITRGPETGAYYHEYFQRGNLRLCMQMCCQNAKNAPMQQSLSSSSRGTAAAMMGRSAVGDAMNRLRLGGATGDLGAGDLTSLLQGQLAGAGAVGAFGGVGGAGAFGAGGAGGGGAGDDQLLQLRQLEQQRDLLMQQQQQQQQQQLQQQQLAALGLNRQQQSLLSASGLGSPGLGGGGGLGGSGGAGAGAGSTDMGLGALQRSNANAYLAMVIAQEKMQAQMAALGQPSSVSPLDFQRQQAKLLQTQQAQLEQFSQQRMLQAQAAALQQQNPNCNDIPPHLLNALGLLQGQQDAGNSGLDESGKIKRGASAA